MKLQSHIDYENSIDLPSVSDSEFRQKSRNHREFQSKQLFLGDFIPTDENGNVLEQPLAGMSGYDHIYKRYSEAKDRVIFEGFSERIFETIKDNHIQYIGCDKFEYCYRDVGSNIWIASNNKLKTIEDLVKYNLTITEPAVKKYGL